jgi:oligopeptide/dipeptide ABC transporter ATP-binding protein
MSKELEVRNLQISFWTNNGTVKAVRDISFDLEKGETLCIVGESGSGKSVTAKAVMGILAGNSIVEGGEIIYKGSDLLKYSDKDFDKIRGNKITMIFQDPLSSLDPIVKIGKQMTEATLLNGKTNQKSAKRELKQYVGLLKKNMSAAGYDTAAVDEFVRLAQKESLRQKAYQTAREYTESAVMSIEQLQVELRGEDNKQIQAFIKELAQKLEKIYDDAWIQKSDESFQKAIADFKRIKQENDKAALEKQLSHMKELLETQLRKEEIDFSCAGKLSEAFENGVAAALKYAEEKVIPEKEKAVKNLREAVALFEKEQPKREEWEKAAKELSALVERSINPLSIHGNSYAATFHTTMEKGIRRYFKGVKENPAEQKRVEKETEKRQRLLQKKGDAPNVVPPVLVDLKLTQKNMVTALKRLADSYEEELAQDKETEYLALAREMAEKLQALSYATINKVTRQMAYDKAVRIMEDVGIKEPQKRFKQYPFEFSGGMRQRIVIAIAIAANPDILICDEPTTALDVTIQAQIMELINEIKRKRQLSVIFITHDLGVVANMADKVAVMYAGKIVEYGTADDVFYHPAHPYTWALLASMPDLDTKEKLEAIPGTPPNMIFPPVGDAFAERNQYAMQIDYEKQPPLFRISDTHYAATWLLHPDAPKVKPPKSVTERIKRMKELEAASNE